MRQPLYALAFILGCFVDNKPTEDLTEFEPIPFTIKQTNFGAVIELELSEEEIKMLTWCSLHLKKDR